MSEDYKDHKETVSIFGTDYHGRKAIPIYSFLVRYFPKALVAVVNVCVAGNKQHNKDLDPTDIHWARGKSTDQLNTAMRHLLDHGTMGPLDDDGQYHLAKAAWRVLAQLELLIEGDMQKGQPAPVAAQAIRCVCGEKLFTDEGLIHVDPKGKLHSRTKCGSAKEFWSSDDFWRDHHNV